MMVLSHQSQLHVFTHCSLVLHSGSEGLIPVQDDVGLAICCYALLLLLDKRWVSRFCNVTLTFSSAKPTINYSGPIFFQLLKLPPYLL